MPKSEEIEPCATVIDNLGDVLRKDFDGCLIPS